MHTFCNKKQATFGRLRTIDQKNACFFFFFYREFYPLDFDCQVICCKNYSLKIAYLVGVADDVDML